MLLCLRCTWLVFLTPAIAQPAEPGGQDCWIGALTYSTCCHPPPRGNEICWDDYYTPEHCCHTSDDVQPTRTTTPVPLIVPPLADSTGPSVHGGGLGGCEWVYFQEFKARAVDWYLHRRSTLLLFHQFSSIVSQFEMVYESCPAAALTAVLLKLEAVYFEEDPKWSDLFQLYVLKEHRAVASGALLESHHRNGWPLVPGLEQVLRLRALGSKQEGKTFPAPGHPDRVALVVCYCAERLVWLRAFHKLPWREEDRSATMRRHVSLHIYHKCGAMGAAARSSQREELVKEWAPYFKQVHVRFVDDIVRADDCSAYLAYITDHYDQLPNFTLFLHADAPEHIPSLDLLTDVVYAAAGAYLPEELGFLHLAHNYVFHHLSCEGGRSCEASDLDGYEFPELWKTLFASSLAPSLAAGQLSAYCCVQFLVRSARIRLRPRSFFQRALQYFGGTAESYHRLFPVGRVIREADALGRTPCQLAMYIWHVIFGEPMRLPRRQHDPVVPLFLKIQNIEVEALEEEGATNDPFVAEMVAKTMLVEQGNLSIEARVNSLFD